MCGRFQSFNKSNRSSVGASGSGGHGHGNSSLGQKIKLPPREQKKKNFWIKSKQKSYQAGLQKQIKAGSCINCGEQGHLFEACTKTKPSKLLMGARESQVPIPPIINSTNSNPYVQRPKRLQKTNLHTNAWRIVDSEFHCLSALFSFTLEACCDPNGLNKHGLLPYYSEKDSFLTHVIAGKYVY